MTPKQLEWRHIYLLHGRCVGLKLAKAWQECTFQQSVIKTLFDKWEIKALVGKLNIPK